MRRTAINLISVIGGEVLLRGANFAAVVVVARLYGATVLGIYATVLAFATVAVMVADNGLQVSSITEVARRPGELGATLGQLYSLKTLLFLAMAMILGTLGLFMDFTAATWLIGAFITLRTMLYSYCQLHAGALKALDRMPAIGTIQFIHCCLLLSGVGLTLLYSWTIYALLAWLLACQSFEFVLSGWFLLRFNARPKWAPLSACWRMLHRSTPIGITYSTAALILRADVIILSTLASSKEVGYFAAANIPLVMIYVVSWLLGGVALPKMVSYSSDLSVLQAYVKRWLLFLMVTTVPCSLVLAWASPSVVRLLYGTEFASTGRLATMMVLAVPFILSNSICLGRAIALGTRSVYVGTYVGTGVLALVLDYCLGHLYGAAGIAVAIVIREIFMFAVFTVLGIQPTRSADRSLSLGNAVAGVTDPGMSKSIP
ncbi:MAG: oligosaccharide flippase family protein [Acidobacteriia bacterium]|nr:oligosaccharide flippase family protein [Terriglobia bacterium]